MKATDINHLADLYGKKLYNFCLRLCGNTYDAEDLYQDTFLKAMQKISSIDENNNPCAYLCTVAVSLWKSRSRKEARRHAIAPTVALEEQHSSAHGEALEEILLKNELCYEIKEAVSSLDEKLRLCVLLHYVMDMPLSEIAKIADCPEGTVKSRLHTARKQLKEVLTSIHH